MHGAVKANGASWIWRGRPEDHPLSVQRHRKRDRDAELRRQRAMFDRLVVLVAKILDRGEPTRFRFEANCKYALRVDFIVEGRSWALSDFMAGEVLRHAFASLNVRRPSWYECQPEYARTKGSGCIYCQNPECGRPIERLSHQVLKFCSEQCRVLTKNRRTYAAHAVERAAYAQGRRDRLRAAAEPRLCKLCGGSFQPLDDSRRPQEFCGTACRTRYAGSCNTAWRPYRLPSQRDRQGRFVRAE